jgi:hypothetical protein
MASITSRIAGWTAGRLKGEKARKRTMDWMQKTGVGQLLGVAGDAALIGGALKGAGALKSMIAPTGAGAVQQASTTVAQRVFDPSRGGFVTIGGPAAAPTAATQAAGEAAKSTAFGDMLKGGAKAVGRGAMAAGRFAKENIEPLAVGASAISESLASSRRTALEEEQLRLEQERRNRLAELLMPMFQAEVQRYGQSNRG